MNSLKKKESNINYISVGHPWLFTVLLGVLVALLGATGGTETA